MEIKMGNTDDNSIFITFDDGDEAIKVKLLLEKLLRMDEGGQIHEAES